MYTRTLSGPEKQPLLCEFFYEDDTQLQIQVPPPRQIVQFWLSEKKSEEKVTSTKKKKKKKRL